MSKKSGANTTQKSNKKKTETAPAAQHPAAEVSSSQTTESASNSPSAPVTSNQESALDAPQDEAIKPPFIKDTNMTLTLKGLDKRSRNAIYTGAAVSMRIPVGAFPNKKAPATLEFADGSFSASREKKTPLTPEQRKEARKNAPKLTLAEKVAKAEKRTEELRAKLATDLAKATKGPETVTDALAPSETVTEQSSL